MIGTKASDGLRQIRPPPSQALVLLCRNQHRHRAAAPGKRYWPASFRLAHDAGKIVAGFGD